MPIDHCRNFKCDRHNKNRRNPGCKLFAGLTFLQCKHCF